MNSFNEESIIDLVLLFISLLLDSLCKALWESGCEVYFLDVVSIFILAEDEQPIRFIGETAHETHSADRVLVEVWFTQQVKETVGLDVYDFEVSVDHGQVETSLECNFRVGIFDLLSIYILWHDYLNFGHREACLFESSAVLAEQYLL